jgi:hypothetical protein
MQMNCANNIMILVGSAAPGNENVAASSDGGGRIAATPDEGGMIAATPDIEIVVAGSGVPGLFGEAGNELMCPAS